MVKPRMVISYLTLIIPTNLQIQRVIGKQLMNYGSYLLQVKLKHTLLSNLSYQARKEFFSNLKRVPKALLSSDTTMGMKRQMERVVKGIQRIKTMDSIALRMEMPTCKLRSIKKGSIMNHRMLI